jgi:CubicO group peptidase (beta-lactamase class C family)
MFRERYQYSNAGFAIAGEMVARAEGTSYSALLDARILGPLGMRDTALVTSGSPGAAQQLVPGYLGDSVPGPMRAGEGSGARRLASVTGWIDSDVMAPGGAFGARRGTWRSGYDC